jgi:hypothetical protein
MGGHTPGPWKVTNFNDIMDDEGDTFVGVSFRSGSKERAANARLIAAAPDLLKSLKETLHLASAYGPEGKSPREENSVLDRARATIAKAEG